MAILSSLYVGRPRAHQSDQVTKSSTGQIHQQGCQRCPESSGDDRSFSYDFSGLGQPQSAARDTMIDRMGLPRRDTDGIVSASRAISGDHCLSIELCRSGYAGAVKDL